MKMLGKILAWIIIAFGCLFCFYASAQTTSASATITDSDGNTWNNGTVTATFVPGPVNSYKWPGGPIPNQVSGSMNGSGTFTISLPDNTTITPKGSAWRFSICPNASAPCVSAQIAVSGSSMNLSSQLSAIAAGPRFPATSGAYGYADVEVSPLPVPGGTYWNVNDSVARCWNGSSWATCSGSGSGTVSDQANGVIPLATGATAIGAQSHLNENTAGYDTFTQPMTAPGVYSTASGCTSGNPLLEYNGTCTSASAGALTVLTPPSTIFYGDSITSGVNVTNFANSYVARISNAFHTAYSDYAVSGAQACDVGQNQVFQDDSPTLAVPQPFRSLLVSTNDADVKGPGTYEATFNGCYNAILAWETVPLSSKVIGSNGTTTGTCTNDTTYAAVTGENCTSSGATITLSLTTTGGPVYIWFRSIDSDPGTWTYAIDGGTAVSETTALPTPIATQNGGTQGPVLIRVTGVASGNHSIVFTMTSSGGNMPIIAIGTPYSGGVPTTQPYLLAGSTPTQLSTAGTPPGGTCASSVSAYRADIASDVALIGADTSALYEWFPQNYLQASTAANDIGQAVSCYAGGTNYVHPNDNGHSEMAAALQAAFQYVPAVQTLYSSQLFQTDPTNYTVLPTDSVIYSNGGTITLPDSLPVGMEVAILNYAGNNAVTITATSGAGDVPNLPAGGQSGVLLHHLSASLGWFAIATWGLPPTINKLHVTLVNGSAYTVTASDWNVYLYGTSPSIAFPSSGLAVGQSVQVTNQSSGTVTVSGVNGIGSLASGCGAIITQEYTASWQVITLSCPAPGALNLPVTVVTSTAHTVGTSDADIFINGSSVSTITFPSSGVPVGNTVAVVNQSSATATISGVGNLSSLAVNCAAVITQQYTGAWYPIGIACNGGTVRYVPSLTPSAVSASTCGEQTFTVAGLATGEAVTIPNPPSALSHVWIGSARVSANNTLAILFCGDSTGGTPPTGTYSFLGQ